MDAFTFFKDQNNLNSIIMSKTTEIKYLFHCYYNECFGHYKYDYVWLDCCGRRSVLLLICLLLLFLEEHCYQELVIYLSENKYQQVCTPTRFSEV